MVIGVVPLDLGGEQQGRAEGGLRVILVCGQSEMSRRTEVCLKLWCEVGLVSSIGSFEQFNWNTFPRSTSWRPAMTGSLPPYAWRKSSSRLAHVTLHHNVSIAWVCVCVCFLFFIHVFFILFYYFFAFTFTVPSLSWRGTIAKSWKIN